MTIFLYIKKHKDTGLKYLGKTIASDPYMLRAAEKHRGKTWKVVNGKRVWMDKEIVS